jgi:hypothetical protein
MSNREPQESQLMFLSTPVGVVGTQHSSALAFVTSRDFAMEIPEEAVRRELVTMGDTLGAPEERASACRALVRWAKKDSVVARVDDWVRLYVAVRRCGGDGVRLISKQL